MAARRQATAGGCPQPCFSATFSNGVETDFSPLLPEMWAESISVDGLVSKNELLTTKRSFHTSPEYTVTRMPPQHVPSYKIVDRNVGPRALRACISFF